MGLFSKKEEVPELPPAPTLPEIPKKEEKKDLPELPSFPSSSKTTSPYISLTGQFQMLLNLPNRETKHYLEAQPTITPSLVIQQSHMN